MTVTEYTSQNVAKKFHLSLMMMNRKIEQGTCPMIVTNYEHDINILRQDRKKIMI